MYNELLWIFTQLPDDYITIGIIQPCDMTGLKLEEIALLHLSEGSKDNASS